MDGAYEELHRAAEARGLRVLLSVENEARPTHLSRLAVADRDRREVVALPIKGDRGLEDASAILVEYLATASSKGQA